MTVDRALRLADLQGILAKSNQEDQQLRALIGSEHTTHQEKRQAVIELTQLSCDLTAILLQIVKHETQA